MQIFPKSKKGQGVFDSLSGLVIALVTIGIVLTVGFLVMAQAQDQIVTLDAVNESNAATYTTAYNASRTTQTGVEDVTDWLAIIVVILVGAALIALVSAFGRRT